MKPETIQVRPIRDVYELWEVYALTHDCYVETEYIHRRPTGLLGHYPEFDHLPDTTVLVAVQDDQIVGSLSYTVDGPAGLIIEKDYPNECRQIREEKRHIADFWRLVIRKSCRSERQVLMALMIHAGHDLLPRGITTFLLDVHEKHSGAYERLFNASVIARRTGVPGLEQQHIAATLLRFDAERLPARWMEKMPPTHSYRTVPSASLSHPGLEHAKQMAEHYEHRMQKARQRLNDSPVIQELTSPKTSEETLLLFLINYCAYDVSMNKPTENWIRRAGWHCAELGLMGHDNIFKIHAEQQAHLHWMLAADVQSLVGFWNKRFGVPCLNAKALLSRPIPIAIEKYRQIHEEFLTGHEPFRQFSMKYESDRLALEYGAWTVRRCMTLFGADVLARLTFLQKKTVLDVDQIQFNWLELGKLLAVHPDFLDGLVDAGEKALKAYERILENCMTVTKEQLQQKRVSQPLRPAKTRKRVYANKLAQIFSLPHPANPTEELLSQNPNTDVQRITRK